MLAEPPVVGWVPAKEIPFLGGKLPTSWGWKALTALAANCDPLVAADLSLSNVPVIQKSHCVRGSLANFYTQ